MSASVFNTKEFKKLFAEWNERLEQSLEQSGTPDIEDWRNPHLKNLDMPRLKEYSSTSFGRNICPVVVEIKLAYIDKARMVLDTYKFKTKTQKKIWELHCQLLSYRKISSQVRRWKFKSIFTVRQIIKQIQNETGITNGS